MSAARASLLTAVAIFAVVAVLLVVLHPDADAGPRGCRITMTEKRAYGVIVTTWTRICPRFPGPAPRRETQSSDGRRIL